MSERHDELLEMADAYVLGILSEADARAFAAHLSGCERCQRETREYALVAEGLGRALPQASLPPALRARVLARATAPVASSETGDRVPAGAGVSRGAWLALAASLVAMVMAGLAWQYREEAQRARSEEQAARQQVVALEQQVAALESAAASAAQTRAVLSAADLARVDLSGQAAAPSAAGRVFWSATHGLVFAATNLPPLPPGRVYQLWVVADAPVSAGIAEPGPSGAVGVTSRPSPASPPKAFALTIEPEGGRPSPTGAMFLLGALAGR
jgi:anti-sigma-K factor RskA